MQLYSLYLKNFRAYEDTKIVFDKDLNIIIGQNDIGKSTILEALDIFFGQEVIKIDISDYNINANDNNIIIGVEFIVDENFELVIDSSNKTFLQKEYLLNRQGHLEIIKKYEVSNSKISKEHLVEL